MTFSTEWRDSFFEGYDHGRLSGNARRQRAFGGAALVCVAFACAFTLWNNLAGTGADQVVEAEPKPATAWSAEARRAAVSEGYAKLSKALHGYAALFDSRYLGFPPGTFSKSATVQADAGPAEPAAGQSTIQKTQGASSTPSSGDQVVQSGASPAQQLRLPPTRTASLREAPHMSRAGSNTPADKPTIFEKLFGKPAPLTLAYAAPDDGGLGEQSITPGRYDRWTAVYDISAHTVYMPDGTKLEAHSGYGSRLDDPRHADERMRGVTPPTVYDLEPRESLFHGVQALRLIPVDDEKVFGRTGLLAHTYMLGPNGDSNGCVSFRDYNAFLQAYLSHQIKRLAVVTRLD